ncbi:MAG TPA: glycosyltransferase family 4 protein [Candidatus Nanoarchaeia archaeon]|nr:glycosyltransferase family 4 protein [Candidatus Nanoarchaeia archaeon]
MIGWEYPPYKSGGLGTACSTLTNGLASHNIKVTFVLPVSPPETPDFLKILGTDTLKNIKITPIPALLSPYTTLLHYDEQHAAISENNTPYSQDLFSEVYRFTLAVERLATNEDFDLIHAHDWMTFQAGINLKKATKKPLILQVHATEFDRTVNSPNPTIVAIEREGLLAADLILANSKYTKRIILKHYPVDEKKIRVVYLGTEQKKERPRHVKREKKVLFVGRFTQQKGPERFLEIAQRVNSLEPDTTFVMAGQGELLPHLMFLTEKFGLTKNVTFPGFLTGEALETMFASAACCVMPSAAEPFGLVALEALSKKTPVIISTNAGVTEVVKSCLTADYEDIDRMTTLILTLLRDKALQEKLGERGQREVKHLNVETYTQGVLNAYAEVTKKTV